MNRHFIIILVAAPLTFLAANTQGQDWVRFRGPNGGGESEADAIPITWTGRDCRWNIELPGGGHSSPVVWQGQVFVTSAKADDGTRILQCLKSADGSQVWRREFPAKTHPKSGLNSYASTTPTVDRDHVYTTWATPEAYVVAAVERQTGREVWRRDLGPFVGEHGLGASPILCGDLLIVPNEQDGKSFVVALDRMTGKERWKTERRSDKVAYSTPILYRPKDGAAQLILTSGAHGVASLDPKTGASNWELPIFKFRTVGSPTIASGLIIASCGEGGGGKQMVAITPGDAARGVEAKVAYEFKSAMPYVPVPVAKGELLFLWADNGVVACYKGPTGKMLWRERIGGRYFASPIRVGDRIYCPSSEGEMVVVAAADKYKLLGKFSLGEGTQATPAVSDGVMYVRTLSHLMAVGGK